MKRLAFALALVPAVAAAQDAATGAIRGVVSDDTGAPVVGAIVEVTGSTTSATTTDDRGSYVIAHLPPAGDYVVTVREGQQTNARPGIDVELGKVSIVDLTLPPGEDGGVHGVTIDDWPPPGWCVLPIRGRTFEGVLAAAAASQADRVPSAKAGPAVRHRRPLIDTHSTELVFRTSDLLP